jgi:hypothetical protein
LRINGLTSSLISSFAKSASQRSGVMIGWSGADLGDLGAAVDVLGSVAVTGDGQQNPGLDLREAVDHRARAELRGAARPDRAEAGRGHGCDHGLRDVRQVGHDPVASPDAELLQPRPGAGDLVAELRPVRCAPISRGTRTEAPPPTNRPRWPSGSA